MEPFAIGLAGLGLAGAASVGAFGLAFRQHRRRRAAAAPRRPRSAADRMEALAVAQAELGLRLDALSAQGAPEERLQAMAGQLLGLIRDKNATFETALAGLDQLRARMRALEQMGEPAEARALFEGLGQRLDGLQADAAARAAAVEARIAALEAPGESGAAELAERLSRLHEAKDAGLEAMLQRLAPLEARLGGLEGELAGLGPAREGLKRLEARLEALQGEQGPARTELAALKAETGGVRALAAELSRLHAQKEALAEQVMGRLAALEKETGRRDPKPELDRLAERIEGLRAAQDAAETGLRDRIAALEGAENPFAEVSAQLTRLYAQKDATVEAVLARLAPLEARLAEIDPQPALDRFAERLEATRAALEAEVAALRGGSPFAEVSAQLTRLYAQKDAAVEAVLARLQPLEAQLAERDPQAALARLAERLEAVQGRVSALETAESPFVEVSEQLAKLYAQKDATVEIVFARLAPLEATLAELERGLAERDPRAALARFAERLEAVQGRVSALETAESPFAEVSEQLARLYAQKDATVEIVFARLAPLEATLAELERGLAERDPRAALDRFAERLEAVQGRVAVLEAAENPFAEVSEQLTRLYAQKDAAVEAVLARLAPLEAQLAEIERGLAARDPRAALDRFAERLEAVQGRVATLETAESPFAEVSAQLTGLYAQKDAAVEAVLARLQPLEAQLAEIERGLAARDPQAALARFVERLEAVQGRVSALETAGAPFAEVSAQLTGLYAQKDAAVEAVLQRLQPLEAQLAAVEGGLARVLPLAEDDPRAAVEGLRARLESLHWAQGEVAAGLAALQAAAAGGGAFAGIAEQLARLAERPDGGAALERLAPLETRVGALEARPWDPGAEEARSGAQAIAAQLMAVQAAAAQTAGLADRLAALEARLPRPDAGTAARAPTAEEIEAIWALPRIVSLHQK